MTAWEAEWKRAVARNWKRHTPSPPVFLTAFCDASFRGGPSGFAYWIRDSERRLIGSHSANLKTSTDAELMGVIAAIRACLDNFDPADILVVKCDCQAVVKLFRPGGRTRHERSADLAKRAINSVNSVGMKLIVKWTKGHSTEKTPEAYLNDRVDVLAREAALGRPRAPGFIEG